MDGIISSGRDTLAELKSFNVSGARVSLENVQNKLNEVDKLNSAVFGGQISYLAAAVSRLTDEEINHSLNLLDKFIAGQVIPAERIQVLTTNNLGVETLSPVIYKEVGHNNISLYRSPLRVIEPNLRAEFYPFLQEVKAILAGMTATILTILLLVFDYTVIMSVIRRKQQEIITVYRLRKLRHKFMRKVFSRENYYGMAIGAVLLTGMFILSGGGFPYLLWLEVHVLGSFLGFIAARYAEKISPVSEDEIFARESLGMSYLEIMREIVIPSSRPGLLQIMNRRKTKFQTV